MRKSDFFESFLIMFGGLALIIFTVFIAPLVSFWLAYLGGWIVKVVIGKTLCLGLNTLFHTAYFVPKMIPIMAGTLGWIGGFFKSSRITTKNTEKKKYKWR